MIAFDTSVLVAGFSSWHEHHESAVATLDAAIAPVLITVPEPLRVAASDVVLYLRSWFGSELIALEARASSRWWTSSSAGESTVARLRRACGGYGATLTSADRRARPIYSALGVSVAWLPGTS